MNAVKVCLSLLVALTATLQMTAASTCVPTGVEDQGAKILAIIKYQRDRAFLQAIKNLDATSGESIDYMNGFIKTAVIINNWIKEFIDNPSLKLTRDNFPARFPIAALEPLQPDPHKPHTLRFRVHFFNNGPIEPAEQNYMDLEYDHSRGTIEALERPAILGKNTTLAIPTQAPSLLMKLPAPSTSFFNLAVIDHDPEKGGTTLAWLLLKKDAQEGALKMSLKQLIPHGTPLERKEAISAALASKGASFPGLNELIGSYGLHELDTADSVQEWFDEKNAQRAEPGVSPSRTDVPTPTHRFPIAALTLLPGEFNFRVRFLNNKSFPKQFSRDTAIRESFIDMHYNPTTGDMEVTHISPLGTFNSRKSFFKEIGIERLLNHYPLNLLGEHPQYAVIEIPSQAPSLVFPLGNNALLHIIVPDHSPETGGTKLEWWIEQTGNKRQLTEDTEGESKEFASKKAKPTQPSSSSSSSSSLPSALPESEPKR